MTYTIRESLWHDSPNDHPQNPKLSSFDRYRLEETCHHEASHVLAAHQLKIPLSRVSVIPGRESLGHTELKNRIDAFNPKTTGPNEVESWVRKHGMVALAGAAGSLGFSNSPNWQGASADLEALDSILMKVAPLQRDREMRAERLWEETKSLIRRDWRLVEAIADALVQHKTLDAKQVREIIEGAKQM